MMIRSAPPFSMNLALMPVPAPAAMIGSPRLSVARKRSTTSFLVYGFPFPVHGFGISGAECVENRARLQPCESGRRSLLNRFETRVSKVQSIDDLVVIV